MINGERCTRACGFCLVDTRQPEPLDPDEPERVAEAVGAAWVSRYAVVTAVARDDLADGGARRVRGHHRRHPAAAARCHASRCSSPTARATPTRLDVDLRSRGPTC